MKFLTWAILFCALPFLNFAQSNGEFKQRITGFVASADSVYERKDLNLTAQNIGIINEQEHDWTSSFMLKSKRKKSIIMVTRSTQNITSAFLPTQMKQKEITQ